MIPTLLLATIHQTAILGQYRTEPVRTLDPYEVARVRSFILAAHRSLFDGAGALALPESPGGVANEIGPDCTTRDYGWGGVSVTVDPRTGLVVAYHDDSDDDELRKRPYGTVDADKVAPRRVSDAQARALALRYHQATDSPYGIEVFSVRDHRPMFGVRISTSFTATVDGVPYDRDYAGYAEIGRDDGRLHTYLLHALATPFPRPPQVLKPRVSVADARLTALRAVAEATGRPLAESSGWPFAPCIAAPRVANSRGYASFLTPDQAARVKAGEGLLAYAGQFVGGDPADDRTPRVHATVDALDGRLLSLLDYGTAPGRGGASAPKAPPAFLAVPAAARPWRVGVGKAPWSEPAKANLTPVPGAAPATGTALVLTDGRAAFPALYDAPSNLLAVGGKTYRPGPALAALLRRRAKP